MGRVAGYDHPKNRPSAEREALNWNPDARNWNLKAHESIHEFDLDPLLRKKPVVRKKEEAVDSDSGSSDSNKIMNRGIQCALRAGDKESFIKRISANEDIIQQHIDDRGNSILHLAASLGHVPIVEYIVSTFEDVLEEKNFTGETAFHVAARSGNLNVIEYLVKCTTDCALILAKTKNKYDDTPLHAALKGKHADVALYLLEY